MKLPGLANPDVVQRLFEMNSAPWRELARDHIRECRHAIQTFVQAVLDAITDHDISEKLQARYLDLAFKVHLENAHSELEKILAVHKRAPLTTNSRFQAKIRAVEVKKIRNEIADTLQAQYDSRNQRRHDEVISAIRKFNIPSQVAPNMAAAEDAFETMLAYYEVYE